MTDNLHTLYQRPVDLLQGHVDVDVVTTQGQD